jgi:hypothetical protein
MARRLARNDTEGGISPPIHTTDDQGTLSQETILKTEELS